jgi:hypothetical protein
MTVDEKTRVKAFYEYENLDTEAEKSFDDLALLASEICETPIALISLIDPKRQWFKSAVGLDAKETERDIAFCAHAIHQDNIFEIPNALEDILFLITLWLQVRLILDFTRGLPSLPLTVLLLVLYVPLATNRKII